MAVIIRSNLAGNGLRRSYFSHRLLDHRLWLGCALSLPMFRHHTFHTSQMVPRLKPIGLGPTPQSQGSREVLSSACNTSDRIILASRPRIDSSKKLHGRP